MNPVCGHLCYSGYMTTHRSRSVLNTDRNQLVERMAAARDGGDRQEIDDALTEAKHWLRDNRVGDNEIRNAQFQLWKALPPAR